MDYLSSMYIDNEMSLNEKKIFVEKIRSEPGFYTLTLDLIAQEQVLQKQPLIPDVAIGKRWRPPVVWNDILTFLKPLGFSTAGFCAAMVLFFVFFQSPILPQHINRFILFEPAAGEVELAGSFTGWQRVSMKQIGNTGYWELFLEVDSGEHRFAYFLDGDRRITDPTLPAREKDDFGGENSILWVEKSI